jgi:hypothetical protein
MGKKAFVTPENAVETFIKCKKENKEVTARIGPGLFYELKENKDLEIKMWKEKYENAVKTMGEVMQDLEEVKENIFFLLMEIVMFHMKVYF